jgi:hypothetical protein
MFFFLFISFVWCSSLHQNVALWFHMNDYNERILLMAMKNQVSGVWKGTKLVLVCFYYFSVRTSRLSIYKQDYNNSSRRLMICFEEIRAIYKRDYKTFVSKLYGLSFGDGYLWPGAAKPINESWLCEDWITSLNDEMKSRRQNAAKSSIHLPNSPTPECWSQSG